MIKAIRMRTSVELSYREVFNYWSRLAVRNPEQFELDRKEATDELISQGSVREQKLKRQLQSRINAARVSDPFISLLRINRMMMEEGLLRSAKEQLNLALIIEDGVSCAAKNIAIRTMPRGEAKIISLLSQAKTANRRRVGK